LVDVVTVVTPVAAVLAGTVIGQRGDRSKRREDRAHEEAKAARQAAADERAEQAASIAAVLTSAAEWQQGLAGTALGIRYSEARRTPVTVKFDVIIESHSEFGKAVFTALVKFTDQGVLSALGDCLTSYQEGFDIVQDAVAPRSASAVPVPNSLDAVRQTLGARVGTLQAAARAYFTSEDVNAQPC
jgi:hypothetical protein